MSAESHLLSRVSLSHPPGSYRNIKGLEECAKYSKDNGALCRKPAMKEMMGWALIRNLKHIDDKE